jgi:hypothetical protein
VPLKIAFSKTDLSAIDKRLEGLSKQAAIGLLHGPLLESAEPAVEMWRYIAPQPGRSGYTGPGVGRKKRGVGLANAIRSKVVRGKDSYVLLLIVGAEYDLAPHEHLVERGHEVVIGRQGMQVRDHGRFTKTRSAVPKDRAMRRGGKVRGGWYGRKAMRQTESDRGKILLESVGRVIDAQLRG